MRNILFQFSFSVVAVDSVATDRFIFIKLKSQSLCFNCFENLSIKSEICLQLCIVRIFFSLLIQSFILIKSRLFQLPITIILLIILYIHIMNVMSADLTLIRRSRAHFKWLVLLNKVISKSNVHET